MLQRISSWSIKKKIVAGFLVGTILLSIGTFAGCGESSPSGESETPDGITLIDDLIACSGPGWWDRAVLIERLEKDADAEIERLKELLELCRLAENSTATPVPTPRSEFSADALTLLALYHELQGFKDESWFHQYCYSVASPAHGWAEYASSMESAGLVETGTSGVDIWRMGLEYCNNQGDETAETQFIREYMKPDWLSHKPVPTPKPEFAVPR